jgi:hypothetical protein
MRLDTGAMGAINRVFGMFSIAAGLCILLGGGFWIHHNHFDAFVTDAAVAQGEVVENRREDSYVHHGGTITPVSHNSYRAIVRFTTSEGTAVTLADRLAFKQPSFNLGQSVNPGDAMIDRGRMNYILPGLWVHVQWFDALGRFSAVSALKRLKSLTPRNVHGAKSSPARWWGSAGTPYCAWL